MNGITHAVVGIAAGLAAAHVQQVQGAALLICVGAGMVGGLLPDIDHGKSIISRYTPGVGHAARLVMSHRGPTHTAWFAIGLIAALLLIGAPIWGISPFAAGIGFHLLCDMATPQGVRLLLPVSYRTWRVLPGAMLGAPGLAWALETLTGAAALMLIVWLGLEVIR